MKIFSVNGETMGHIPLRHDAVQRTSIAHHYQGANTFLPEALCHRMYRFGGTDCHHSRPLGL
jgi:hypothetical protein